MFSKNNNSASKTYDSVYIILGIESKTVFPGRKIPLMRCQLHWQIQNQMAAMGCRCSTKRNSRI